jgi:hypothetical protein
LPSPALPLPSVFQLPGPTLVDDEVFIKQEPDPSPPLSPGPARTGGKVRVKEEPDAGEDSAGPSRPLPRYNFRSK